MGSVESELDWWKLMGADKNVGFVFIDSDGVHVLQEGKWSMAKGKPKPKPRPKPKPGGY